MTTKQEIVNELQIEKLIIERNIAEREAEISENRSDMNRHWAKGALIELRSHQEWVTKLIDMTTKLTIALIIVALLSTFTLRPVRADNGIMYPASSGIVVAVDLDRNNSTGNSGRDMRVANALVSLTYADGAVQMFTTDQYGLLEISLDGVASIDATCPALVGNPEGWQCASNVDPATRGGQKWIAILIQPVTVNLPIISR